MFIDPAFGDRSHSPTFDGSAHATSTVDDEEEVSDDQIVEECALLTRSRRPYSTTDARADERHVVQTTESHERTAPSPPSDDLLEIDEVLEGGASMSRLAGGTDPRGRYRLLAEIGRGGMATVYLAVLRGPEDFQKFFVVKRMKSDLVRDPLFMRMFVEEARLAARLNHPNIVTTFEVGQDDDTQYIVMEYLEGATLYALLGRTGYRGAFTFAMQVRVLQEVVAGLRHAYDAKGFDGTPLRIVHRDMSPHNVIVTRDGHVKILDFGIAKAADSSIHTTTGVVKGKATYMAPEQAAGIAVDGRSDLFAVGVMLWEAIAGRRLYGGLSNIGVLTHLLSRKPYEAPGAVEHGYPALADEIAMRALAWDPAERFQSAGELHAALGALLHELGGPPSLDEIGATVTAIFSDDHSQLRRLVELELARPEPATTDEIPTVRPPKPRADASGSADGLDTHATHDLVGSESVDVQGITAHSVVASIRGDARFAPNARSSTLVRRRAAIGALAASAVVVVALVGIFAAPADTAKEVSPAAVASASVAIVPAPGPSDLPTPGAAPVTVRAIVLRATPPSAALFVDGRRLPSNPFTVEVTVDSAPSVFRAEAPGYESLSREIDVTRDQTVTLSLTRPRTHRPGLPARGEPTAPAEPVQIQPPSPPPVVPSPPDRPATAKPAVKIDKGDPW
jgi:serine/threonine-protein kinase